MTIRELLALIEANQLSGDTEIFGTTGPLKSAHIEEGTLVLDETAPGFIRKLATHTTAEVLWSHAELFDNAEQAEPAPESIEETGQTAAAVSYA